MAFFWLGAHTMSSYEADVLSKNMLHLAKNMLLQIRHFGYQLIEDLVKRKWAELSEPDKQQLKTALLECLVSGTHDLLAEKTYVKEKLASIVVEVAKREWPQHWTDMMDNLLRIAGMGVCV
jgi:exportin-5